MPFYGSIQGSYGIGRAPETIGNRVLLIYDVFTVDTVNFLNAMNRLKIAIQLVARRDFNGSNPNPAGYDSVILLDGTSYNLDLNINAQIALRNYVSNGGKYIGAEWNAYQVSRGRFASMTDLVLLQRERASAGPLTYTISAEQSSHPVFAGFIGSINLPNTGYNIGTTRLFSTQPSTVLATHSEDGSPGIVIRTFGLGRVVSFSHAGNYVVGVLSDPNVQRLYYNCIAW
jgi:hypothetical protein